MRGHVSLTIGALVAQGVLVLAVSPGPVRGDDTSFFGKLFRFGNNAPATSSSPASPSDSSAPGSQASAPASAFGDIGTGGTFLFRSASASRSPGVAPSGEPGSGDGPSTPELPGSPNAQPRLTPRPRVSPAVTSADPLLTRMALGRSNDGSQFGMIFQIFTDGTVIDSEGVHHLSPSDLRPLLEAIQSSEVARLRGHCSTPSNDFVDHVHIITFERRMGRLQAHSFSYAGNPEGCDSGIHLLHSALESIQVKLSRQPGAAVHAGAATGSSSRPSSDSTSRSPRPSSDSTLPATGTPATGTRVPRANSSATSPPLPDPTAAPGLSSGAVIPLSPIPPR
jgi:hypothetical protein